MSRFKEISIETTDRPADPWRKLTPWNYSAWEEATRLLVRVYAETYPDYAWRRLPRVVERFSGLREVTDVTSDELVRAVSLAKHPEFYDSCGHFRGAGINARAPETEANCWPGRGDISQPLMRDPQNPNRYRIDEQPVGVERHERFGDDFPPKRLPSIASVRGGNIRIDIDGFEIEYRGHVHRMHPKGLLLFDPATQTLIHATAKFRLFRRD